jgi:hypothetical protein
MFRSRRPHLAPARSVAAPVLGAVLATTTASCTFHINDLEQPDAGATGGPDAGASRPFRGTPLSIPGAIGAKDFDLGGEGVAYHDLTPNNVGEQYRPQEGVDIYGDAGYEFVGEAEADEWLKFTVSVAATRSYALEVRASSVDSSGVFHVEVDGTDVTGPLVMPSSDGGQLVWLTVAHAGVPLPSGTHVLRLSFDQNGLSNVEVANVDYLRFEPGPDGG